MGKITPVQADSWAPLRRVTSARIALGRVGGSLPTHEWLDFKLAHATARDAVYCPFDATLLANEIATTCDRAIVVDSAAPDRRAYLLRPDLGRRLADRSRFELQESPAAEAEHDLAIVVTDGLSALAVHRQAPPLLNCLVPKLRDGGWQIAPLVVARFGRVAIEDEIGQLLRAQIALILIGERPGLGSPDSLGAYLVHSPRCGKTDADRNCVSNIRPEGLSYEVAADTIHYFLTESRRRGMSGVQLKDQRTLLNDAAVPNLPGKSIELDSH